ncbi:acyl-CoA dehydrogenase family protein [Vibrio parahaemolyticus]|uniref:acyl-CoA dehydrogenase family protein n=1 Tax=Vibrio parahaemolyticus TaxID=670 RepID=UPI000417C9F3|nr:acyl-CoA dehydrogenase family protein [Vibrio parahaemolyticus]ELA8129699.1 hypothetical protein [Vibrio parahaemolyticus]ELB2150459.1 hypothetical protein [Vibrio parahaemolyticus]ELB2152909.1 hypothetical protein [Vibrio parahaemolyticus]ELB2197060.1 hypothetical protein [Vibrio parahaemolyticus]ELB2200208.1 hypothetical protein [Vibrio parahaemolyticus]
MVNHALSALKQAQDQIFLLAEQAEQDRMFPRDIVGIMEQTNAWQAIYPKEVGGGCESANELVEMWQQCSYIDGSFGWLAIAHVLAASHCSVYLPKKGFDEVFSKKGQTLIAGQYQPNGRGYVEEEGYRLTGRWSFGSGIHLAEWVVAGFIQVDNGNVIKTDAGDPEVIIAVIPIKDVEVFGDWKTTGLKGTGSINYSVNDIFVPKDRCFKFSAGEANRGSSLYRMGILPLSALSHGCWALGMTNRVLTELRQLGTKIVRANEKLPLASKDSFKEDWARIKARALASEALLVSAASLAKDHLQTHSTLSEVLIEKVRLAATFANEICAEAAEIAYKNLGASAISEHNNVERVLRDIQTGRQHMMISPQSYIDVTTRNFERIDEGESRNG